MHISPCIDGSYRYISIYCRDMKLSSYPCLFISFLAIKALAISSLTLGVLVIFTTVILFSIWAKSKILISFCSLVLYTQLLFGFRKQGVFYIFNLFHILERFEVILGTIFSMLSHFPVKFLG